jgi:hypothetical protein
MRPTHVEPSENTETGEFARRLARAMGTAVQPDDDSAAGADMLTWGEALATVQGTNRTSLDQAFADTATDLLSEKERLAGIPTGTNLTTAQRQQRLTAAARANFSGSAQDILAMVLVYDSTAVLYETLAYDVFPNQEMVFEYGIVITEPVWADARKRREIYALMRKMEIAGARGNLATGRGFYCDAYLGSRTDDTLLGS